ncbi:MAG: 4Fe-4S binding protein [Candidatus Hadarchaeales archaeon]
MIEEMGIMGIVGASFAIMLVVAARKMAVKIDERIEKIREKLPGASCGACGLKGGCDALAEELVKDPSLLGKCRLVGPEERREIGKILGIEVKEEEEKKLPRVRCTGESKVLFEAAGERTCSAFSDLAGGPLACPYGCLGMGDCVRACPFDALRIENGLPLVDEERCRGCGLCEQACPRGVIKLLPKETKILLLCNSPASGKEVSASCASGCIKCRICEKACPVQAIKLDPLPIIDSSLCNVCGTCVEKCPRKVLKLGVAPLASTPPMPSG